MDNILPFNTLDYIFISVIVISAISGGFKGFIRVFFSFFAWVISGFLSIVLSPYIIDVIEEYFSQYHIAQAVAAVGSYIIILTALLISTRFASKKVKKSSLSDIDRIAGVVFGFIRGLLLPAGIYLIFLILNIDYKKFEPIQKSKISVMMFNIAPSIFASIDNIEFLKSIKIKQIEIQKLINNTKGKINQISNKKAFDPMKPTVPY